MSKVISDFGTLLRLAKKAGQAELKYNTFLNRQHAESSLDEHNKLYMEYVEAKRAHDDYVGVCLTADEMNIGINPI